MEQIKKTKIVFICHFSNNEIRHHLPLSNFFLRNLIKKTLGKRIKNRHFDFAPWVTNLVKEFEKFVNIELHVISPHPGLKTNISEFNMRGVYYHFYQSDMPILHLNWPSKFSKNGEPTFNRNRRLMKSIINSFQPDIINLIGTENSYYSVVTLDIINIPIFVTIQTAYSNPELKKIGWEPIKSRSEIELQIHQKEKYFGCSGRMFYDLVKNNNPNAIVFKHFFTVQKPDFIKEVDKEFDFVFFGQIIQTKGIEDALEALSICKKYKEEISLHIVGHYTVDYKLVLDNKIEKLGLRDNVFFTGYFSSHLDMLQYIKKAKVAVLPNKADIISSSIAEAMLLNIPVVTYKTSGTPYLNKDGETVLIAEIGDTRTMANHMLILLNEPKFAEALVVKAKEFVQKEWDNSKNAKTLLYSLKAVINHYHNNSPIPKELLFNLEEFPVY